MPHLPSSSRILLVDCEPAVLSITRRILQWGGYPVTAVADPADALLLLDHGESFTLLAVEAFIPRAMSGPELALAALQRLPKLQVLYLHGGLADLPRGAHFVDKPFTVRELLEAVQRAIG